MTFASPWYLLGALGVLAPILIHLFGQRRARKVPFPSLMLLQRAQRQRTSFRRLRQWWLLLLRCLAIVCLSLALARPALRVGNLPWLPSGPLVFLVDDSPSMAATAPGGAAWTQARQVLGRIREARPRWQRYGLWRLSDHPSALAPWRGEMPADFGRPRFPEQATPSLPERLDTLWRYGWAERFPEARWVLLTDLQASAWRTAVATPAALKDLLVVDCGAEGPNAGLTGLEVAEPPALVGRPLRLRVIVRTTPPANRTVPVAVTVNGGVLPPTNCRVIRGQGEALAEWLPRQAGDLKITATIPSDRLAADNARHLVIPVRQRLRVLVGGPDALTRWVRLALSPTPGGPVAVEALTEAALQAGAAADVAVLLGAPTAAQASALRQFVADGGGLLAWGPAALTSSLPEDLNPMTKPLTRRAEPPLRIGSFDGFRPPLQAFANARAGDLQEPSFRQVCTAGAVAGTLLASFTDGSPALAMRTVGAGRVVSAGFSLDPAQSDLVRLPVFVPLVHRLVGYVARRQAQAVDANLDPLEGDLTRLAPAELRRRLAPVAVTVCRPEQAAQSLPAGRVPLASIFWLLVLLAVLAELWFLARSAREASTGA